MISPQGNSCYCDPLGKPRCNEPDLCTNKLGGQGSMWGKDNSQEVLVASQRSTTTKISEPCFSCPEDPGTHIAFQLHTFITISLETPRLTFIQDAEPAKLTSLESSKLYAFREGIHVLLQTVLEEEYHAALKLMSPPKSNFKEPVEYDENTVIGMFAGHKMVLIKTESATKAY